MSYHSMAYAMRLAPLLLIAVAVAVDPAAAQSPIARVTLQSADAVRSVERSPSRHDPLAGFRLFQQDRETLPVWVLPFGSRASERDRRGLSFSVRPGRRVKATAKLRF
jgi:hypothetical protein